MILTARRAVSPRWTINIIKYQSCALTWHNLHEFNLACFALWGNLHKRWVALNTSFYERMRCINMSFSEWVVHDMTCTRMSWPRIEWSTKGKSARHCSGQMWRKLMLRQLMDYWHPHQAWTDPQNAVRVAPVRTLESLTRTSVNMNGKDVSGSWMNFWRRRNNFWDPKLRTLRTNSPTLSLQPFWTPAWTRTHRCLCWGRESSSWGNCTCWLFGDGRQTWILFRRSGLLYEGYYRTKHKELGWCSAHKCVSSQSELWTKRFTIILKPELNAHANTN